MNATSFAKCRCLSCDGHIEFDTSQTGQTVNCPHCELETRLYVPGASSARPIQKKWFERITRKAWLLIIFFAILLGGFPFGFWSAKKILAATQIAGSSLLALILTGVILFFVYLAALWLLFPFLVYSALQRMENTLKAIERNTRQ